MTSVVLVLGEAFEFQPEGSDIEMHKILRLTCKLPLKLNSTQITRFDIETTFQRIHLNF